MHFLRGRRGGQKALLPAHCPLLYVMTCRWCAWIQSRRKTDAIESGGLHLCVSDVYADGTKPGYITERERAVARCCADPGEHDRTSRGRRASSTYKSPDKVRRQTRRRGLSLRRNSSLSPLGVQAAVDRWKRRDCDCRCVRLPDGGK